MVSKFRYSPVELISKKRDGGELTTQEIEFFVLAFNNGDIPNYQMSAMLMAIYIRGMSDKETADLTLAFCKSGKIADLSGISGPKVDKHSTGGVGDKVSLILAPLAASCGLVVPMMTGRGLGHTGGTLDKLESIPGFKSRLTTEEFTAQLAKIGVAMICPTMDIAPVDKKIYALRDVTGTVGSIPLIVSSIMSKKICEGPNSIVLDVKIGGGAFITYWDEILKLAKCMISAGKNVGLPTVCLMTDMNQPLGKAVGNWVEMREAILTLNGEGPSDVVELVIALCAQMLLLGGKVNSFKEGMALAQKNLKNGKGLAKLKEMISSQGGDCKYIEDPNIYPKSKYKVEIKAENNGYVSAIATREIGLSSIMLGGGRLKVEDVVDFKAGIIFKKKIGDIVEAGEVIAIVFTERENHTSAVDRIRAAFTISKNHVYPNPLISHILTKDYLKKYDMFLKEQNCDWMFAENKHRNMQATLTECKNDDSLTLQKKQKKRMRT